MRMPATIPSTKIGKAKGAITGIVQQRAIKTIQIAILHPKNFVVIFSFKLIYSCYL